MKAEETASFLELLEFALRHSDTGDRQYLICREGEELRADDELCLVLGADRFAVSYVERGEVVERAEFKTLIDAANHFYWRMTRPTVPMNFASRWENETGKKLFE